MKKIGIVYSGSNDWVSVSKITKNLMAAYRLIKDYKIIYYQYLDDKKLNECFLLAKRIHGDKLEKIIFIDNEPHPLTLLKILYGLNNNFSFSLYFHLYGRFIQRAHRWGQINDFLKGKRVCFICSSLSHKKLVGFFLDKKEIVKICPSSLDTKRYGVQGPLKRKQTREKYNIKNSDFLIVYAGRISVQKNCNLLCFAAKKLKADLGINVKIMLAGSFDDKGVDFFNRFKDDGFLYQSWIDFLQDNKLEDMVQYIGFKNSSELSSIFNACDCFASLSTFHQENFGISPLEALACGTPTVLSRWGGHLSFGKDMCKYVDVKIQDNGIMISKKQIYTRLKEVYLERSIQKRIKVSDIILRDYSIKMSSSKLQNILSENCNLFTGFNSDLESFINERVDTFSKPLSKTQYYRVFKNFII